MFANYVMFGVGEKEGTKGWGITGEGAATSGESGEASTSKLAMENGGNRNDQSSEKAAKGKGKQKSLSEAIHEPEWTNSSPSKPFVHKFEVCQSFPSFRTMLTK